MEASLVLRFYDVFFNSNLFNVMAYLNHQYMNSNDASLSDVALFLARQRKYLAKLAVMNSLAENEVLNYCKNTNYYDEADGVVKIDATEEQLKYFQETKVDSYHMVKLEGCPFAKTLGVKTNTMVEVYEYFDDILIEFLELTNALGNCFFKC